MIRNKSFIKGTGMPYLVIVLIFVLAIALYYWYVVLIAALGYAAYRGIRVWRKNQYFASEEFQKTKQNISRLISEHNDIVEYVKEIDANGTYQLGESGTATHSDLATFENTSAYSYKRDRNEATYQQNVYNCSLQIARNASREPIKYFVKYFDIPTTEEQLKEVEALAEKLSRVENAIENLSEREKEIVTTVNPPKFILKYYEEEFRKQVGFELSKIEIPYEEYCFEYVSAGGNSSQKTTLKLNVETLDALMEFLDQRIKYKKSAAGQRALMTAKFREHIKVRDSHTCQTCGISIQKEPHLLLEVDHIIPVSKGGLSVEENLQTLCWRCNRSKSNKIIEQE